MTVRESAGGMQVSPPPVPGRSPDAAADAIDGVQPEVVLEPSSADEAAACLAWAARGGLPVVVRGAGTKTGWGRAPRRVGAILSMARLNQVLDHEPGDLTVSVQAGTPLRALNAALAAHGQWLPLDPPWAEGATIGGLLSTNDSGPLRHRFGTPRDLLIGIQLATTDGSLAASGGRVVKNVAGYDLGKLVTGSFGALAVIVAATFKLVPRAPSAATVVVREAPDSSAAAIVGAIMDSQLEPQAFEVRASRGAPGVASTSFLLRFASFGEALDEQVAGARARLAAIVPAPDVLTGEAEAHAWDAHAGAPWRGEGSVVRVSWLPGAFGAMCETLDAAGRVAPVEMIGRAAVGAGLVRLGGDPSAQARAVDLLRQSKAVGNVVLVRAGAELKALVDVWGPQRNADLFRAIKRAMDPAGVLGAGRGPL